VVADAVNPLASIRAAWRDVARRAAVAVVEVEVVCSDATEHRRRVESRSADIPGLALPTRSDVQTRAYERWDGAHLVIDIARQPLERGVTAAHMFLLARERAVR
jgi:predicted kinase